MPLRSKLFWVVRTPTIWPWVFVLLWSADFVLGLGWSAPHHGDTTDPVTSHLIARSHLPWSIGWYPYSFSGLDATAFTGFVPLDVAVFRWLPPWAADGLLVAFWASIGTGGGYLLGIRTGLGRHWSVIAGLSITTVFLFQGPSQAWLALPLVLAILGHPRFNTYGHMAASAALGVLFALSTNIIVAIPFALGFVVIWAAIVERNWTFNKAIGYAIFLTAAVAVKFPALVTTMFATSLSHKMLTPQYTQELGDLLQSAFWTWISGSFFFVLALSIAFRWPLPKTIRPLIWGLAALSIFMAAGNAVVTGWPDTLGIFRALKLSGFLGGTTFFAVFAACGILAAMPWRERDRDSIAGRRWQWLWPAKEGAVVAIVLVALLVNAGSIKLNHAKSWTIKGSYRAIYDAPYADILRERISRDGPARVVSIWSESAFANAQGFEAADGYTNLVPSRYYELFLRISVGAPFNSELASIAAKDRAWGNRLKLNLDTESEKVSSVDFGRLFDLDLLSLLNVRYVISRKPLSHPDLVPIWTADYDWFSLSRWDKLRANLRENFTGQETFSVYENRRVFERFRLVCDAQIFESGAEVLNALSNADHARLATSAFLSRQDFVERGISIGDIALSEVLDCSTDIELLANGPDRQTIRTSEANVAILVWSSSFMPWWRAEVDGEEADIFPVNHALTGVRVPAGTHRVDFTYAPPAASWAQILARLR